MKKTIAAAAIALFAVSLSAFAKDPAPAAPAAAATPAAPATPATPAEDSKATKPMTAQQSKMKACNAEAKEKALKGAERKAFMKTCLKSDKK